MPIACPFREDGYGFVGYLCMCFGGTSPFLLLVMVNQWHQCLYEKLLHDMLLPYYQKSREIMLALHLKYKCCRSECLIYIISSPFCRLPQTPKTIIQINIHKKCKIANPCKVFSMKQILMKSCRYLLLCVNIVALLGNLESTCKSREAGFESEFIDLPGHFSK